MRFVSEIVADPVRTFRFAFAGTERAVVVARFSASRALAHIVRFAA